MRTSRVVVMFLAAVLALAPAVGFAASDLSASPTGKHHGGRLHQQPDRAWRTLPSTPAPVAPAPAVERVEPMRVVEPPATLPLVVRVPFIPPRA